VALAVLAALLAWRRNISKKFWMGIIRQLDDNNILILHGELNTLIFLIDDFYHLVLYYQHFLSLPT
jgi:hypothetical protein